MRITSLDIGVSVCSTARGVLAMRRGHTEPARWSWKWRGGDPRLWARLWTPSWHEGRGPYVSLGLGPIAIYRGY
jgi:hypothetical protein